MARKKVPKKGSIPKKRKTHLRTPKISNVIHPEVPSSSLPELHPLIDVPLIGPSSSIDTLFSSKVSSVLCGENLDEKGELHPIFRSPDSTSVSISDVTASLIKSRRRGKRPSMFSSTEEQNHSSSSSSLCDSDSDYINTIENVNGRRHNDGSSDQWSEEESVPGSDNDDDMDVSDIDDILLGGDETFQRRLLNTEGSHGDMIARWLSRNKKRRKQKGERKLFGRRKTRKRRTAATESTMSPEVEDLIRCANNAYLERNIPTAILLLEEAIQKAPGLHDPFHLLGLIYEEEFGDKAKALDCYFLGAHLVPEDHHLWKRIAALAQEQGKIKQAIYCYRKCLQIANGINMPLDETSAFDLAMCYITNGEHGKAVRRLELLFRNHPGDPFLGRELAKCYHQLSDYDAAVVTLESCISFKISWTEWKILEQSKGQSHGYLVVFNDEEQFGTYAMNRQEEQFGINGDAIMSNNNEERSVTLFDPHATNMLSEVYIESRKFEQCEKLLSLILNQDHLETAPLDFVVKLAACHVYLRKENSSPVLDSAMASLLRPATSRDEFSDLYILLGEALYQQGKADKALKLFKEVASLESVRSGASTWVKIARCQLQTSGLFSEGQPSIERLIHHPDSIGKSDLVRNLRNSIDPRLMLSQVLSRLHRSTNTENIVLSIPAAEMTGNRQDEIPPPIPKKERLDLLRQLQNDLDKVLHICSKQQLIESEVLTRANWISKFLRLMEDSELDTQRVVRKNFERRLARVELDPETQKALLNELGLPEGAASVDDDSEMNEGEVAKKQMFVADKILKDKKHRRPTGQNLLSNSVQYFHVKQDLELVSLEDVLGWKDFSFFLETAIGIVMKSAGMHRAGVELIEAVLANRRTVRTQQYDLDRRLFQTRLKRMSLQLSIEGGLYRIALAYIRAKYIRRPDNSERVLQAFGRLLFCGTFSHSTVGGLSPSLEREALLENRAWCVRQLLQRPRSYALTLLTGHFCSLSGRSPLAVAEYTRAHRLVPRDDLTCLCLATAFLNLATSRSVQDRHAAVLRGFAMLATYSDQRRKTSEQIVRSLNSDLINASRNGNDDQRMTPQLIDQLTEAVHDVFEVEVLYNLARAFHHFNLLQSALPLYLRCLQLIPNLSSFSHLNFDIPAVLTVDAAQLKFCASHNLATIFKTRGSLAEARSAILSSIVWGD